MKRISVLIVLLGLCVGMWSQPIKQRLNEWIVTYELEYPNIGKLRVTDVKVNSGTKRIGVYGNSSFQNIPFRPELVERMLCEIDSVVSGSYPGYKVNLYADKVNVLDLIPNYYREVKDKKRLSKLRDEPVTFLVNENRPYQLSDGLQNRHIALWASHGWYYDQKSDRWRWQRARLFETVEDKLPLSFVIPYLLPMLENAGAYVWMPRERDVQENEVIVDNDGSSEGSLYREHGNDDLFRQGGSSGFAHKRSYYIEHQNPFTEGTYRTMKGGDEQEAFMEWLPDIPERGYYAVSVSYKHVSHGSEAARYRVNHLGGSTEFVLNQTMGGGTWVYLGNFLFEKGVNPSVGSVVLSNVGEKGSVIVGDAVRFGGGMGNVARRPAHEGTLENIKSSSARRGKLISVFPKSDYRLSERARYLEGSRYWLQWAGAPDSVYSFTKGLNDYTDDYASRGIWVNWLARGSALMPDSAGLNIPLELSLAFHTDATTKEDAVVGTLGIYTSDSGSKQLKEEFPNKQSRYASRDLTDIVLSSIVNDIERSYNADWSYRGMWNKSYAESRRPEVPAMLLELLSHQNYEDMLYALDPRFRFTVSRAIYKGILRFVATQHNIPYVVQPLPVHGLSAVFKDDGVSLSWSATIDTLESSAMPTGYVVYSRRADGGFDNGIYVSDTNVVLPLSNDVAMSYRVVAVNSGGASMPSEVLSVCRVSESKGLVMIVNGFTRIGGPQGFWSEQTAGFPHWLDRGVPDGIDVSYVGAQYDYDRTNPWTDDDAPGWGASYSDYETRTVMGNSFDNVYLHGKSIVRAGYSYVSSSLFAVEQNSVSLGGYELVDLILGEQKRSVFARDSSNWEYKTFSLNLQAAVRQYCQDGGKLLVTGAHVGSDLLGTMATTADKRFGAEVLHISSRTDRASRRGEVKWVYSPISREHGDYVFATEPNEKVNGVESADGIEPVGLGAYTVMRYKENNISAAVGYRSVYNSIVLGFPFESIVDEYSRDALMRALLDFLNP